MSTIPFLFWSKSIDGHMGVSAKENRKEYFAETGIDPKKVIDAVPSHGNKIKIVSKKDGGKYFEGVDGLITEEKELVLAVTCADCMPIALFNPVDNSIGLIHCGFRGLENGIIAKAARLLTDNCELLTVYIGPHICRKHYRMNLGAIAKKQLIDSGIEPKNINIDKTCTYEDKTLFSYRRGDKNKRNLYLFALNI